MGDNAEIQLTMLQKLMALFQNQEAMAAVQKVTSTDEFIDLMKENGIIQ